MPPFIAAAASGFLTCATLIVAIGAQNVFVLRQGLQRRHIGAIVLFCACADTLLVAAGVGGAGTVLAVLPGLETTLTLGGAAFLLWYGVAALKRATGALAPVVEEQAALPLGRTLIATAAFTFLNPHVYLDTVMLMGAIGAAEPPEQRHFFVAGAGVASLTWFSLIGFGARWLAPLFTRATTWRSLDGLVGGTMLALSFGLFRRALVGT